MPLSVPVYYFLTFGGGRHIKACGGKTMVLTHKYDIRRVTSYFCNKGRECETGKNAR